MPSNKRTKKDDDEFMENLRQESPIKSEIIIKQRRYIHELLEERVRLLKTQIRVSDELVESVRALKIYREQILQNTELALKNYKDTEFAGAQNYRWDFKAGWTRTRLTPNDNTELSLAK